MMKKNRRTHIQEDRRCQAEGNVGKSAEIAGAVILTLGSVYLIFSFFMF